MGVHYNVPCIYMDLLEGRGQYQHDSFSFPGKYKICELYGGRRVAIK